MTSDSSQDPEPTPPLPESVEKLIDAMLAGSDAAEAPEEIGPYKILDVLGEGGMGTVYLAEQKEPVRRRVAVKLIKLGMDSKQVLARFAAEQQALAMMNHDNIAKVFDAGTTERGQPYFVMEHVPGLPITEHCNTHRLTTGERLRLFQHVCSGVQHAHQKGVIHRDLKPSNILVTVNQGRAVPKIIDFGVARATDHRLVEATIFTELGRLIGTPAYMSPEQAEMTSQDIDTRTDIYSLGVILYELLVDALPFPPQALQEAGLLEIQRKIREDEPAKPSNRLTSPDTDPDSTAQCRRTTVPALRRELSGDLDWIVMMAMEKDRNRRYGTANELSEDLRRHLEHEPVQAGPPSAAYRLKKLLRKHRGPVAALASVLALLVTAVVAVSSMLAVKVEANARIRGNADRFQVDDLMTKAEDLWPALPDKAQAMKDWLDVAEPFVAEALPFHRGWLAREDHGDMKDPKQKAMVKSRSILVAKLEKLANDQGSWESIPSVRARYHEASTIRARSIDQHRDEWDRTIADIARSPRYGMRLTAQVGLVPLGADPKSGLQEFAYLLTGEIPERDPETKRLKLDENSAIVLVLIPGAEFTMGAVKPSPGKPEGSNVDPLAQADEGPVRKLVLAPFFLSKNEMTQAQWKRAAGSNPSIKSYETAEGIGRLHPVENLSWEDADRCMLRLGLILPTEAQWEYAARAKSKGPRWTGPDLAKLAESENFADESFHAVQPDDYYQANLTDGWPYHAPVDAKPANPFGLHHVLGNVEEWCRDWYDRKNQYPRRELDGESQVPANAREFRVWRGGSYGRTLGEVRVTRRFYYYPDRPWHLVGVRPARAVVMEPKR